MEEKNATPDSGAMNSENPASGVQSSGAQIGKREIPIARNANPAGISTARTVADLPMEVPQETGPATGTTPPAGSELSKAEYPIARNANPAGVSTARTRE